MATAVKTLLHYVHPDRSVLDERPAFDDVVSAPFFQKGGATGCVVLHGIGGTPANVRVVADKLAERGYTVIAPALPGHRETVRALNASTGKEWLCCAQNAYDRLKAEGCTKIFAVGLSLGGILSGLLATQKERPVAGLALICAPIEMQRYLHMGRRLRFFVPLIRFPEESKNGAHAPDPLYGQMYDGFSTLKLQDLHVLCKQLRKHLAHISCPVLFFSAKYDNKVAPESFDLLKKGAVNAPLVERITLENSPHGCTYGPERALVAEKTAAFIDRIATGV